MIVAENSDPRQVPWNKGKRKFNLRRKQVFIDTLRETASGAVARRQEIQSSIC